MIANMLGREAEGTSRSINRAGEAPIYSSCDHPLPPEVSCGGNEGPTIARDQNISDHGPFPIAIVGMAMRLPGGVKNTEQFWDMLINKKDGHCPIPGSRFNAEAFYSDNKPGAIKTKHGYFLDDDLGHVDRSFFSMSKLEASRLDPQQRLLLETVWECMENGGQTQWRGKNIGCYVGVFGEDWLEILNKDVQQIDRHYAINGGDFAIANRISWEYDLRGPSGLCKTFDSTAEGYGRGEAINAVYIKRLDHALRDGDPVRAIIRATAINCDGRTPSISAPRVEAQESLILRTYKKAGISDLSETGFFECHGTGTSAGDIAETSAVARAFNNKGVYIGSVKPNVGHSEGASGLTSLIKATLALEKSTIPPNAHFSNPNPDIPFQEGNLIVPVQAMPWPPDRKQRVSVNCFGIGGTNAHLIMESHSGSLPLIAKHKRTEAPQVLVLSARDKVSLQKRIEHIKAFMVESPGMVNDIVYTLGMRREHLSHRAFAVVGQDGTVSEFEMSRDTAPAHMVFIFTGQGAQWSGMGKELFFMSGCFRECIKALDETLRHVKPPPNWTIEGELLKSDDTSRIKEAEVGQPLCAAIQIALVDLLRQYGITPSSVIGHSSGEIGAAYASGAVTAEVAITVAYLRGLAITLPVDGPVGAMAVVGLPRKKASGYLLEGVTIACDNSPKNVTLSGDDATLSTVLENIIADNADIFCRQLDVSVAYHSHHMKTCGTAFESLLSPILCQNRSMVPLYSTTTGTKISDPQLLNASYWRRNLESPVLFNGAVQSLLSVCKEQKLFIEIGPHSALSSSLREIFISCNAVKTSTYIPTLIREKPQWRALCTTAGRLYVNGAPIRLSEINGGTGKVLTNLPSYPWLHKASFWIESRIAEQWRKNHEAHHELLGSRGLESNDIEPSWRNILHLAHVPWLWDHMIGKDVIFPCAGYVAMIGEATRQATGSRDYTIRRLLMTAPLVLNESEATEIHTSLRHVKLTDLTDSSWYEFIITAYRNGSWQKYCTGQVRAGADKVHSLAPVIPHARHTPSRAWYRAAANRGLKLGPLFRRLEAISTNPTHRQATARIQDEDECNETANYALHPTIIDQALQLLAISSTHGIYRNLAKLCMPAGIQNIYINHCKGEMSLDASCEVSGSSTIGNSRILADGKVALAMEGGLLFVVDDLNQHGTSDLKIARVEWKPHIDLLPARQELRGLHYPEGPKVPRTLLRQTMNLLIESTGEHLQSLRTECVELQNYKSWILAEIKRLKLEQTQNKASLCQDNSHLNPTATLWAMEAAMKQLEQQIPEIIPVLAIAKTISANCLQMLEGRMPSEKLLHKESCTDKLYEYVSATSGLRDFLSLLGHSNPALRVLEIGTGNGFFTSLALRNLTSEDGTPMYSQYTGANKSEDSISLAKKNVKAAQGLEYSQLNILQDPTTQGFLPQSYDLVILSPTACTHQDLASIVKNVFLLVAPGGRLLFHRPYHCVPFVTYIMGIYPGWWTERQNEVQSEVSHASWQSELEQAGFSISDGKTVSSDHDSLDIVTFSRPVETTNPKREVTLLYLSVISDWGRVLAEHLTEMGHAVRWCLFGQPIPQGADVISLIDLEGPFLENLSAENFGRFKDLLDQITGLRTLWVTHMSQMACESPGYGMVLGIARSIRQELGREFATLEVDHFNIEAAKDVLRILNMCREQTCPIEKDPDYEFVLKDGKIHVGRFHWTPAHCHLPASGYETDTNKELTIGSYGLLSSLSWTDQVPKHLNDNEVELDMRYIGLNFRDMMVAMGFFGDKSEFGLEGSAIVRRVGPLVKHVQEGDKVIVSTQGLLCTRKVVSADSCFPLFADLSLQDGATVACVYGTAIHSLLEVGNLRKGQSVLIHSACGGVGLAAIQVCQAIGAEIYATVGNSDKVQYLTDAFHIPKAHIFDSRSPSFFQGVMDQTGQRGVDIVLNSLSGELLHLSWKCVAKFGKMIELGKRDILGYGRLDMDMFSGNRSFVGVDVKGLVEQEPERFHETLLRCQTLFEQGKIQPIRPVTVFDAANIEQAFWHMQTGQHMGKVVVKMPEKALALPSSYVYNSFSLPSNASFLLVGGLGGLGRAVATWMVEKGARHFVFLSRSAGLSAEDAAFIKELEFQNCTAVAVAGDVANLADVIRAVSACKNRIEGVIQMSMVLKNRLLMSMSHEDWLSVLAPKVRGTWNLHKALQDTKLGFFVAFSSISGVCGNTGQANYASANSFLDAFVTYRRGLGLAATVVDLGLMEDIGWASESQPKILQQAKAASMKTLDESELLQALELAIRADQQKMEVCQIAVGLGTTKALSSPGVVPFWTRDARFALWANVLSPSESSPTMPGQDGLRDLMDMIQKNPQVLDDPAISHQITTMLSREIGSHLTNTDDMDEMEISNIVIESLVMIEVRVWARRHLGLELSMAEISAVRTIGSLVDGILKALRSKYQAQETSQDMITGV
ncbi:hypothetical protein N7474_009594 [Penicillium riverlandense]|uniref:uncharacterized protein n=1 Tax=Penicillium riverlandense TaxID=1903569 RepID=UPI00254719D1|nr:uncharacterized protein N7474_009594 [Penicillium riverlandense]KAJ5808325.1 hypothetical protein N7474_009594 [Penicillium riverlandense]